MNELYCPLLLPVYPFKNFNKIKFIKQRQSILEHNTLSDEYFDFLNKLNIKLNHIEIFVSMPNKYYTIHKDQHDKDDFPKLNFIFDGKGSKMNWYKPKETCFPSLSTTDVGSPFISYKLQDVDLIFSHEIYSTSLVQAGVPHNVTSPTLRWSVSTVYTTKDNKLLSWNEICSIFNDYSFYTKL